jgi:hypothetical protein
MEQFAIDGYTIIAAKKDTEHWCYGVMGRRASQDLALFSLVRTGTPSFV